MGHDSGQVCRCSVNHQPAPLELVIHHVWPMGDGGPDDPANEEFICPTTHYNVHELYRAMKREGREISHYEFTQRYSAPVSRFAHAMALLGYQRFVRKAL